VGTGAREDRSDRLAQGPAAAGKDGDLAIESEERGH